MLEKNRDKISVIIPVYNGANFIEDAYNNILGQGIDNIEIIFVDNNSTDESIKIIKKLKKNDSRIKLLKEQKKGAAATRNKGIQHCKGGFIHFFDVDDLLFDGSYKSLKKVLIENENVISVFGKLVKSSKRMMDLSSIENDTYAIKVYNNDGFELEWLKYKSKLVGPPAFLHRRLVFDKIKGFKENLLIGEDGFFHVRLANESCIASLDKTIYHYFRHSNSTVSLDNKENKEKVFSYWDQTVNAYLPYANSNKCSAKFKEIVLKQIYGSIGKQLVLTKEYTARKILLSKLKKDIAPLKNPILFNFYFNLLVLFPNNFLYKFFVFVVLKFYFKYFTQPKNLGI